MCANRKGGFPKTIASFLIFLWASWGAFSIPVFAQAGEFFVASNYSDRYHKPSCKIVKKISKEEKVIFQSTQQAHESGYGPCRLCHRDLVGFSFGGSKSDEE